MNSSTARSGLCRHRRYTSITVEHGRAALRTILLTDPTSPMLVELLNAGITSSPTHPPGKSPWSSKGWISEAQSCGWCFARKVSCHHRCQSPPKRSQMKEECDPATLKFILFRFPPGAHRKDQQSSSGVHDGPGQLQALALLLRPGGLNRLGILSYTKHKAALARIEFTRSTTSQMSSRI